MPTSKRERDRTPIPPISWRPGPDCEHPKPGILVFAAIVLIAIAAIILIVWSCRYP